MGRCGVVALALVACALALSACGGSDSTSSSGSDSTTSGAAPDSTTSAASPDSTSDGGSTSPLKQSALKPGSGPEPSAEFAGKGKNGELAEAGKESTAAEREAASKVVEESFEAAASGDWEGQCETFSPEVAKSIETRSKLTGRVSCATSLERLAKETPSGAPENLMTEPLAALRVNGNLAFAFFHGTGGRDFVIPMALEGGEWKLTALVPQETP